MIPILLAVLAVVDAAFAGFRAAAGRNAAVHKPDYFLRATWMGAGVGLLAIALVCAWLGLTLVTATSPQVLFDAYIDAATRLVVAYAIYATIVVSALLAWTYPRAAQRALATVLVLGPFTLLRPYAIIAGAVWAAVGTTRWEVTGAVILAAAVQLLVAPFLEHLQSRAQTRLIARLYDSG